MEEKLKPYAVAVCSGGLDSTLAVKVLLEAGIKVHAVTFRSVFFSLFRSSRKKSTDKDGPKVGERFGIEHTYLELEDEYYKMVADPPHGFGSTANPCIDCHAWMFRRALAFAHEIGASFISSGEVLGQRPMSQRRDSLNVVERDAGVTGLLVRPLSAKLLKPTIPEEQGVLDREKLYAISGRGRKAQMTMAREWGIENYQTPGGGCLLTEVGYSVRLIDLRKHIPHHHRDDLEILKVGRHFRINENTKIVVCRNSDENEYLLKYAENRLPIILPTNFGAPAAVIYGEMSDENITLAAGIIARYGKPQKAEKPMIVAISPDGNKQEIFEFIRPEEQLLINSLIVE